MSNTDNFEFKSPYETKYGEPESSQQVYFGPPSQEGEFLSPYDILQLEKQNIAVKPDESTAIGKHLDKMGLSVGAGGMGAVLPASGSAVVQTGKYAMQHPAVRNMATMAGPAYQVLRGKPPADLMQRAASLVSQPALERGLFGGTDELSGTSGRARQTMYNTETSRQAQIRQGANTPFTQSTWGATNTGVLVPSGAQAAKPPSGLSAMIPPQVQQAVTEAKKFTSAVAPTVAARGMAGFGAGFSGAETLRTGAEAMKEPAAIPEFVLNALGTIGGLGALFSTAAAPVAIGAPALASVIGMAREGKKLEAAKNLPAKERFEALPETTPGERSLVELRGPAMNRSQLGYQGRGALSLAEP